MVGIAPYASAGDPGDCVRREIDSALGVTSPLELFEVGGPSDSRLRGALSSRALGRWRQSSDLGWARFYQRLVSGLNGDFEIEGDRFEVSGHLQRDPSGVLNVVIASFAIKPDPSAKPLRHGFSSGALDPGFGNLVGVLVQAVSERARTDARIVRVRVVAFAVVNSALARTLFSLGFEPCLIEPGDPLVVEAWQSILDSKRREKVLPGLDDNWQLELRVRDPR